MVDEIIATLRTSDGSILRRMSDLVRDLHRQSDNDVDVNSMLDELTANAAQLIPGAASAAITRNKRPGYIETVAATDRYPFVLDEIQRRCNEGPVLSALRKDQMVRVDDLTTDDRWPRYSREAIANTPMRAIMSFRLFTHYPTAAVLNLYSEQAHAFSEESESLGLVFAGYTALTWNMLRSNQQFRQGLASRDTIGQAKGVLMERFHIDATAAFELLKRRSQESNTPLVALAQRLTDPGSHAAEPH